MEFSWLDPGTLSNDNLSLVLVARLEEDPPRGWVPAYEFSIQDLASEEELGRISLRVGNTKYITHEAGHVGYIVHPEFRGNRVASQAVRLLLPFARRHLINPVWITCNPDNYASRRTCDLAGGVLVETINLTPLSPLYHSGDRQKCRYRFE